MDTHMAAAATTSQARDGYGPGQPTVQLLHTLPDGSAHIDWLLCPARSGDATAPGGALPRLISFRLPSRVDLLPPGESMPAERIADHRRLYLSYEGPISGDRGQVHRLAEGRILTWKSAGPAAWRLSIQWRDAEERAELLQHLRLLPDQPPIGEKSDDWRARPGPWLIHCQPHAPMDSR